MTSNVVGAIANSLKLSLAVKLVNFLINVLIVRYSSMPDLGKIHVNLQLVISACLFMLKEGFRKAALRDCSTDNGHRVITLGVLVSILFVVPCVVCAYTYVTGERVLLMGTLAAAIVAEVLAELPLYVHVTTKGNLTIRNTCDMTSSLVRSLALIAGITLFNDIPLAFTAAQLSAAVSVLIISMRNLAPTMIFRRFQYPTALSYEMILMSFQKFFLAEGERMLSVSLLSAEAIGQLALVNNVGSLVLRIVFAPIEDIASSALAVHKSSLPIRIQTLQSVFLIQVSIGLLALAFGPQSARAALHLLYGVQWATSASAVLLLQFYCLLLLLFAVNGTFEAYYFAIGDSSRIRTSLVSQWLASAAFVGVACAALPYYGPLSILMGNAASMIVRSACCLPIFGSLYDPLHPLLKHVALRILAGSAVSHLALFCLPLHSLFSASPARAAFTQCGVVAVVALLTLLSIRRPVSTALSSVKSGQA